MKTIPMGTTANSTLLVGDGDTAIAVHSGSLPVLGTPVLIALMEEASCSAVVPFLEGDETTVGTAVQMDHTAPTVVGKMVTATATLQNVNDRLLTFYVTAMDDNGIIGRATIKRYLVSSKQFMDKAKPNKSLPFAALK